ncbi:MAG: NAD(P)/FAD-dependent oxidoreductase [Paracoccaceae bacterium]
MTLLSNDAAPLGRTYWMEGCPSAPEVPETLPGKADLLVVGAGYTGLSAAIAASDAGARVVVIDAGEPGEGASNRNGGMFGAHPRLSFGALEKSFGVETARGVFGEATQALEFARGLIRREGIECDFQQTGRIQLAWSRADFEAQKRLADDLAHTSDVKVRLIDSRDLGGEIVTSQYFGGLLFSDHAAIHPRKFHTGLLRAVLGRGVPVVGHCPAKQISRRGRGFEIATPKGQLRAERVVLATNGYTTGAFAWHRRRVFPLPSFIAATAPLPASVTGKLAPGKRMMVETRARHSYFRLSPDGTRILFGGRAAMKPVPLDVAARRLHATMCEIWPRLGDTPFTHVWMGNTGYSFTHTPHVGSVDGVHHAMGFSGSGTVMAPYLGMKAAYQALGDERGATAYSATCFRTSVLYPGGSPHFLKAADLWYRTYVDFKQSRRARRDRGA